MTLLDAPARRAALRSPTVDAAAPQPLSAPPEAPSPALPLPRSTSLRPTRPLQPMPGSRGWLAVGAAAATALAATAALNHALARRAEHATPPLGRLLDVDGVRLHVFERGAGPTLVLLHGNGGLIQDFLASGLVERAAQRHRVLVFDRPGYGHSTRPRTRAWTPDAQADLLAAALRHLGVERAVVLGHSWGAQVAVSLAARHPGLVEGLVLEAGYFYPSVRLDVIPMSLPAVPVLGDVLRHTVSPWISRLLWPVMMRKIFGPEPEPTKFRDRFPRAMAVRPSQLLASAEETAMMIPAAGRAQGLYAGLRMPVAILAGEGDRMVDSQSQSARLHHEVPQSSFAHLPGAGHMLHQTRTEAVMKAIDEVGQAGSRGGAM